MTLDELNKLKPGDMVVIVDQWPNPKDGRQNLQGKMDKWLGQIMTVRITGPREVEMEEDRNDNDNGGWFWYPELIDRVFDGFESPEASDIADFIGF